MEKDIETILWTEEAITQRLTQLASQITADFKSTPSSPILLGVATGAFIFLADLVRNINLPVSIDFIRASSYGSSTLSNGAPTFALDLKLDIQGKHVIVVEDIVDTGNTLYCLIAHLKSKGASSVSVCTLLDKPSRRKVKFELVGNGKYYCGFECPDYFVVGYGLDFAERYRNLPFIGVLKPEIYK
ncbi:Hypoxanthine phosphoribosyltransferase [Heracleum sosnowskyi]|uniref:Hypoxanthine phosphoribosyltransferase n=1 Tax=Heracleum sosnowskyi TaxID=360622 RepID=A0AAD8IIH4_9APIA|nr:Hypoxanthine phosphoribosyltransferase [Heracleum sosnowskyi]KAK1384505.1 Hypoxanthine phosphoribosyltransferase [Heracleum sosnowskyi]